MRQLLFFILAVFPLMAISGAEGGGEYLRSDAGAQAIVGGGRNVLSISSPSYQTIASTPGLAAFTPHASECYPSASAGAVNPGVGAQMTAPFRSIPCHFDNMGKTLGGLAVASHNIGMEGFAQQTMQNAVFIVVGTDLSAYTLYKAQGIDLPIAPDRRIPEDWMLGGMMDNHVVPNTNYRPVVWRKPEPERVEARPEQYTDPNPGLNQQFRKEMMK